MRKQVTLTFGAVLMLALLSACGGVVAQDAAPSPTVTSDLFNPVVAVASPIPGVQTFTVTSRDHTTEPVDYPQSPPVGGPHDPSWQKCEFYAAPVKNEHAVHSLEHGAVWITYQPDLDAADVSKLKEIAQSRGSILVSPYPGLDHPIVASAWGVQLRLDSVDDPRLQEFIDRYAGNGPEPGANCDSGVETTLPG
jgi:hypothetical protein